MDQIEYIEENKRELPIWGIPPFPNHRVRFHNDHRPSAALSALINEEMDLVTKDFESVLCHWNSLKMKVERHLDLLIQLRVLEQQDLAVNQSQVACSQRELALDEAKTSRFQSRSVFIFTGITIVFLPLSFFTSYFSMDVEAVLGSPYNSQAFWMISGPISGCIIIGVFGVARFASKVKVPDIESGKTGSTEVSPTRSTFLGNGGERGKLKRS